MYCTHMMRRLLYIYSSTSKNEYMMMAMMMMMIAMMLLLMMMRMMKMRRMRRMKRRRVKVAAGVVAVVAMTPAPMTSYAKGHAKGSRLPAPPQSSGRSTYSPARTSRCELPKPCHRMCVLP